MWLAEPERRLVPRIDPRTSQIVEEIEIPEGSDASLIAAGEGALWLDSNALLGDGLWKYDLREHRFTLIDTGGVSVEGFTTTPGAVWTVCHKFLRIDAKTGAIEAAIKPQGQGQAHHGHRRLGVVRRRARGGNHLGP